MTIPHLVFKPARASLLAAIIAMLGFFSVNAARAQQWSDPVWSDEFNSRVPGTPPDPRFWTYDVGGNGWGNHELEIYCASSVTPGASAAGDSVAAPQPKDCSREHPNAFQDGQGHLVIRASRVSADPAPTGTWTSARLKSVGLKQFQYGRMEACIRLPVGAGLWPAFWMLGTAGHWPAGGEIDIMENIPANGGSGEGLGPTKVESTIHGPSMAKAGHFSLTQILTFPDGQRIDDTACHVYGAIWSPFMVQMYVDDWRKPFFIRTAADVPREGRWVFNAPFYFLLNLAVGGDWPGPPDSTTPETADMLVDYVRVYQAATAEAPKIDASSFTRSASGASATLQLRGTIASGPAFIACSVEDAPNFACSVDTGNMRNASIVDFSSGKTQLAKITVSLPPAPGGAPRGMRVTLTAYAASGAQSSAVIPLE